MTLIAPRPCGISCAPVRPDVTRVWAIIGVIVLGIAGAVYAYDGLRNAPEPAQAEAAPCDSCSARKKDMSRLREALSAPTEPE